MFVLFLLCCKYVLLLCYTSLAQVIDILDIQWICT